MLIHGSSGNLSEFSKLIKILAEKFHVFAVDLPGFGGSSPILGDLERNQANEIFESPFEKNIFKVIDRLEDWRATIGLGKF